MDTNENPENLLQKVDMTKKKKALWDFHDLLLSDTIENDWQVFFNDNPFILSDGLPIKFNGLYKKVRLTAGIPDYVFKREISRGNVYDYGIIELKRPSQSIIGTYSSRILIPSKSLRIAQQQAIQYLESMQKGEFLDIDNFFIVGNKRYAFIIIGTTSEINKKCRDVFLKRQYDNLLPPGINIYTYDELFKAFESEVEPIIQLLNVDINEKKASKSIIIKWSPGLIARPAAAIVKLSQEFKSHIKISCKGETVNAGSIMGLIVLEAYSGDELKIDAEGDDAKIAVNEIYNLIDNDFNLH